MTETAAIDAAVTKAAAVLRAAGEVVSVGHIAPDGDALGSALALTLAARKAGKEAVASFGDPFELPPTLRFLPVAAVVPAGEVPRTPEVVVAFDTASPDRLGNLAEVAAAAQTLIVADHHVSNSGFGDIVVVDPAAAASAELAHRLIVAAGWEVDADVATCLHVGLVSDTGRFQYSSTSPGTLRLAADLVEAGARPEVVGQQLYERVPFGYLALSSRVLGRAVLDTERSLVWSVMTREDLAATGLGHPDSDPLIDDLRIAQEANVALLLKETGAGHLKGSLRSRGQVDVSAIAAALGGGGHHNAAGFTHPGPVEAAVSAVIAGLDG